MRRSNLLNSKIYGELCEYSTKILLIAWLTQEYYAHTNLYENSLNTFSSVILETRLSLFLVVKIKWMFPKNFTYPHNYSSNELNYQENTGIIMKNGAEKLN